MFCSKCGNIMPDGTRFCPSCGAEQHNHDTAVNDFVRPYGEPLPSVGFLEAIKLFYQNYAKTSGRSRRSEFWWAILFTSLVEVLICALYNSVGISFLITVLFLVLYVIWLPAIFIPGFAILVRRMHDVGKSGWFYLWFFVPIVGSIIVLVQLCKDSQPGTNKYGPNPKFCC